MEAELLYETVLEAVRQGLADSQGGTDVSMSKRLVGGRVLFRDAEGRTVKDVDTTMFFRKVTGVREKLRVLEQKINSNSSLTTEEKAELQVYITRSYGSLTTFNFMFRDDDERFRGSGG